MCYKTSFKVLLPLLLLALPAQVQAQFNFTTNDGAITITGYTGSGGAVTIPGTINGLPVTSIGFEAFYNWTSLTSVTIPNSVTGIGGAAFAGCTSLARVTIPEGVTSIESDAFDDCTGLVSVIIPNSVSSIWDFTFARCIGLTTVTIGNSVTNIGNAAFDNCTSLTSVRIGNSVISLGDAVFAGCSSLTSITFPSSLANVGGDVFGFCTRLNEVYFKGNAPSISSFGGLFIGDPIKNIYYLAGTTGWGATFDGRPTAVWQPQVQTSDGSFGVRTNQFGFNIDWASGMIIVVEACSDLANPVWYPLQTNTLTADSVYFSDSQWTNYPRRFYRLRWP